MRRKSVGGRTPLAEYGVVFLRQPNNKVVCVGIFSGGDDFFHRGLEAAIANVLRDSPGKEERLLQDEANLLAKGFEGQLATVQTVQQDAALLRIVKAGQQADESALASAR